MQNQDKEPVRQISLISDPDHISPIPPLTEVQIDIAHDCTLGEFLDSLGDLQGEIVNFMPRGPAGGNPFLTLLFPTPEAAQSFKDTVHPGTRLSVMSLVEANLPHELESQQDQPE